MLSSQTIYMIGMNGEINLCLIRLQAILNNYIVLPSFLSNSINLCIL